MCTVSKVTIHVKIAINSEVSRTSLNWTDFRVYSCQVSRTNFNLNWNLINLFISWFLLSLTHFISNFKYILSGIVLFLILTLKFIFSYIILSINISKIFNTKFLSLKCIRHLMTNSIFLCNAFYFIEFRMTNIKI